MWYVLTIACNKGAEEKITWIVIPSVAASLLIGQLIYVGHYLDQRRLKQGLYRHPWDDISYFVPTVGVETARTFVSQDQVSEKRV